MHITSPQSISRLLRWLAAILVLKVTLDVLVGYRDYLPPNFTSDFLANREDYFYGFYQWAFYTHLVSGPPALILGVLLVNDRFRKHFPRWHRWLGRIQVANILLLLTPSGLWMSFYAATGAMAALAFVSLTIATAVATGMGWWLATQRRFAEHRTWMWRCFLLLCSAVVIRKIGGLLAMIGYYRDWSYAASAWVSWLAPLLVFELCRSVVLTETPQPHQAVHRR